ncbi:dimethylsulfonioproprionate lyase family protein [Actinomycetospora aeridis]|uniref:Dimethylsulfonioproprionate lyase family protein n=1 Tax=Actinomycetospora aeridis TaxID=3129231 RepID=A0ABU8N100_9PSEU
MSPTAFAALRHRLDTTLTAHGYPGVLDRLPVVPARGERGSLPVLAHLDDALARAGAEADEELADVLRPLARAVTWQQTAAYVAAPPDASFLDLYAHATLAEAPDVAAGLVLLGPGVRYPPHHHPAEEFYLPAGEVWWVHGLGESPVPEPAGELIHHEPWQPHGMWTGERAALLVYVWIGAVGTPSAFC